MCRSWLKFFAVVHEVFCFVIVEESMASEEAENVDIFQLDEQEHGDQDGNAKDIAALVDQIHERCEANQFPMILPGEVCSSQQHFAKETLNLLDKTETVELQSFTPGHRFKICACFGQGPKNLIFDKQV